MGRKARPAMRGLEALGARLKQIRQQYGLSQMKLAKQIGFDPAHGYKYILRLEKGQVPNPTLRTIAACLEACGASWQAVVDALPSTGTVSAPSTNKPPPAASRPESSASTPGPQPPAPSPSPLPRRRDSRPMREQLRSRRIAEREIRTRRFWSGVKQAEDATASLLRSQRVSPSLHRAYLAFTRACCSTLDAFDEARPELVERELARLVQPAVEQGLDRAVLMKIQSTCTQVFRTQSPLGSKGPAE